MEEKQTRRELIANFARYGPTETTIGNTMFPRVPSDGKPSNIGCQFDNVGTYVLRVDTASPVLRGAVGELCIAGELVGPGYLNKPELTEEKFQYLQDQHERVYRTGDLVRILHDNTFEYLGRADDQVKLRGQRLEVAEINEVIKRGIDEVRDVTTLVVEHKTTQRMHLVSFLVPGLLGRRDAGFEILKDDASRKTALLAKEICQGKLPPYMVPTHIVPVNRIPLSSNNKIEVKALKLLYNSLSSQDLLDLAGIQNESSTTWTESELVIVSILTRILGSEIECISKHSNIFRLGLDSISVINFAHSLKNAGFPGAQVSRVMQSMYSVIDYLPN
jgi:acyl-coenzyme A synthetase/AMP-(fatty) acid ligase